MNIPFNGDPLFYSLENAAKPITTQLFSYVKEKSSDSIKKGKKIFSNTVPPKRDSVRVKKSSTQKPMGKYTSEEKEFLENILKKAN